ncbi:MAG TPA: hypothetical protein VKY54_01035 [Kiloniellales bacterium]|nr:hypothetical protein [Kiloniellales bacterium]
MEVAHSSQRVREPRLSIQLFGHLAVTRGGMPVELPPSRKVRALLGFLAVAPRPVSRSRLSDLLGDLPSDPRGELRWCLSKLRSVVDEPARLRVQSLDDAISLDLSDCAVDALAIEAARRTGLENVDQLQLRTLCDVVASEFLENLDLTRSPQLDHWLSAQRRHYRACQEELLRRLIALPPEDPVTLHACAERWVEVSPLVPEAQLLLLQNLLARDRLPEAELHFASAVRLFEAEGLDADSLRHSWRDLRKRAQASKAMDAVVVTQAAETQPPVREAPAPILAGRASLAIMPFTESAPQEAGDRLTDGLTHDIITRLAKLHSMFVIARGSVFALADQGLSPTEAARRLKVDYFAHGILKRRSERLEVAVELVETHSTRLLWSEVFVLKQEAAFLLLDEIGDRIVAAIANEVETAERNRAVLKAPSTLNAWEAYHRGLWHMYRFTQPDNESAQRFFRQATRDDPTFARAFAGLSFTHWQKAFQRWGDSSSETDAAFDAAGRSLMADDQDPAAHLMMGRALWLRGQAPQAVVELEQAVHLSPNLALGHYALSFVHAQTGDPQVAIAASDHSRSLSPYDPLLFGMLGTRAMAHVRLGQFDEAVEWALKAAARPNAHILILAIAAHCLALAGREEEGRVFAAIIRQSRNSFRVDDFLSAFRFAPETESLFRKAARRIGLNG